MSRKNVLLSLLWYHPKIHEGVAHYAGEQHWNLHFQRVSAGGHIPASWTGDGVITGGQLVDDVIQNIPRLKGKVVQLGHASNEDMKVPSVSDDHEGVVDAAIDYFLENGFRTFASFSPLADSESVRMRHFRKRISELGHDSICLVCEYEDWRERHDWLVEGVRGLPSSTAVFCQNDEYASEVLQAAMDGGVPVPSQISVMGVRNDALICEYLRPKLSSVDNNLFGVGYKAASLLDQLMNGEEVSCEPHVIKPLGVVERESTSMSVAEQKDPAYHRAMLELKANYLDQNFSCNALADLAGMSLRNLYKVFERHAVASPATEIQLMRLREAKRLLEKGGLTMEIVAERSGFGSARALYKVFRQHEGMSPGEYRKRLKL
ncbi:Helix-turn-helix domain-containing protein [Rubritalea squalenifaciens DSM 18772]|uniref:Helix-turn-helix domain-containing protein n=1 Tax=Rubritalea squalenifaciens DSM 18772 TaxID=1123071 RepID=A0A1M6GY33_9BACT|nr:XylR family transcriptional regulator [Rubritalea squalenifaciens]SHJ14869.1 Helix-turn-helix domain-containing protein [Rubritalea squalenifaciens DSM 18772]